MSPEDRTIARLEVERDELQAALTRAMRREGAACQRCEWVATALHGDPMFGAGAGDALVVQVNVLRAELAQARLLCARAASEATPVQVAPAPATVASEPVGWANRYNDGFGFCHTSEDGARYAVSPYGKQVLETSVPLYRHPTTIADAIALLVREGAVRETLNVNRVDVRPSFRFRDCLILPTTGAAHE